MTKPRPLDVTTAGALDAQAGRRIAPVVEVPAVFMHDECIRIIALHDQLGHHRASFPGERQPDAGTKRVHEVDPSRRHSDRTHIVAGTGHDWIYDRVAEATRSANEKVWGFQLSFIEPLQLLVYREGGHIDWHSDLGDRGITSRRKVSATILLSPPDAYDGGDLEVLNGGRVTRPGRAEGQAVFFPSFQNHRVTAVTRGTRAVLIVWTIGERPFV